MASDPLRLCLWAAMRRLRITVEGISHFEGRFPMSGAYYSDNASEIGLEQSGLERAIFAPPYLGLHPSVAVFTVLSTSDRSHRLDKFLRL